MNKEKIKKLLDMIDELYAPTSYNDPEDSVGFCAYCGTANFGKCGTDCEIQQLKNLANEIKKEL